MSTASKSLREVFSLDNSAPKLAGSALVMIDFQNTYTEGVMELDGHAEALAAGARLLAAARAAGTPVVHVVNDSGEGSPYDIRARIGAIHDAVAPVDGEPVVVKQLPDSFEGTDLLDVLTAAGFAAGSGKDLVLAGFMTHMCVLFTAQGAVNHGFRPTVVADATATRALAAPDGTVVDAKTLAAGAFTTVTDRFGVVVPSVDALG